MKPEFRADLHCHSNFSDGTDAPQNLIQIALEQGLSGLSITDHDTIAAYKDLSDLSKHNIFLLSGVEFSAAYRGEPIHILGYAFDLKNEAISKLCVRHKQRREERNQRIIEKLRHLGFTLEYEELKKINSKGSIGRPHIAHALLKKGIVTSIQEAFEVYLAEGKPAYDPGHLLSVEETIATIHQGKGKAVLAHPHLIKRSTTVKAMLKMPFDGLEGYYARFSLAQSKRWVDLAIQKKWLLTGGSDYHGETKPYSVLGSSWIGKETFDQLYQHFRSVNNINI